MTRLLLLSVPLLLLTLATGCCQCGSSTGWSFQMGRPATLSMPTAVQQLSGPLAVTPLGVGPVAGAAALAVPPLAAAPCPPTISEARPAASQAAPSAQVLCTLEEVCRRLERLEQQRAPRASGEALPLPKGP